MPDTVTKYCICGATITRRELPEDLALLDGSTHLWVGSDGSHNCYPDADNEADRAARHEPDDD